jgi:hypothetical protein
MSGSVDVKVEFFLDLDITEVSPEHRNEDGITEIIEEVLDACVYDIPGAELKQIAINIQGLD